MSPRFALCAACAVLAACARLDEPQVELPDALRVVGVVQADGASSPLVAWPPGAPLPIVTDGPGPHLVYGYTEADLAPLSDAWRQGRLQAPSPCVTPLPAPAWFGALEDGALEARDPAEAPSVTVSGLEAVCPSPEEASLVVDVRGTYERCPQTVARVGCGVQVRTECGLGQLDGWVGPGGEVCLEQTGGTLRCPDAPLRSGMSTVCEGPRREVEPVLAPATQEAPFTVERVTLLPDRVPYVPTLLTGSNQIFSYHLRQGYAYTLTAIDGAILVGVTLGEGGDCRAPMNAESELLFLDPESLEIAQRVPASPCPQYAVATAEGFVVSEAGATWRLARYGRNGVRIGSVETAVPVEEYGMQAVVAMPERDLVVSFYRASTLDVPDPQSRAVFQRLSDLAVLDTLILPGLPTVAGAARVDARTIVLLEERDRVAWLDVPTRRVTRMERFPEQDALGIRLLRPHVLDGRVFTTVSSFPGGTVWTVPGPGEDALVRNPLDSGYSPVGVAAWPDGRWLTVGVSLTTGPREAQAAFYDPRREAFEPGLFTIGDGLAASALRDAQGRLLVLLPWSAEVVRLTPR